MLKLLIFGYGNPGRNDDGLGNEFVEKIKHMKKSDNIDFDYDSNYQLNIEDAERIKDKDLVVFVDASTEEIDNFCFTRVNGEGEPAFTTHAANPEYIFRLCKEIFGNEPVTLLLHIKGYSWLFQEGLSEAAQNNLRLAVDYFMLVLSGSESADINAERLLSRN